MGTDPPSQSTAQRTAALFSIRHISLALHLEEGKNLNLEATRL